MAQHGLTPLLCAPIPHSLNSVIHHPLFQLLLHLSSLLEAAKHDAEGRHADTCALIFIVGFHLLILRFFDSSLFCFFSLYSSFVSYFSLGGHISLDPLGGCKIRCRGLVLSPRSVLLRVRHLPVGGDPQADRRYRSYRSSILQHQEICDLFNSFAVFFEKSIFFHLLSVTL